MSLYREHAAELFGDKVYGEFLENLDAFAKKMDKTDFDDKTKEKYTNAIEEYYFHYGRARQLEADFAVLSRDADRCNELYKNEPSDRKAEQYKKQFYDIQRKLSNIKKHHELAKEDMRICEGAAQTANISAEKRMAELEEQRAQKNQNKKLKADDFSIIKPSKK